MPAFTLSDWPDGVVARYLTVGGGNVDLTDDGDCVLMLCAGCGFGDGHAYYPPAAHRLADRHAGKCRRVPSPAA